MGHRINVTLVKDSHLKLIAFLCHYTCRERKHAIYIHKKQETEREITSIHTKQTTNLKERRSHKSEVGMMP